MALPHAKLSFPRITFSWTPEVDWTFSELKRCFTSTPVLVQPDPSRQFFVDVDASDIGIGGILSQLSIPEQKCHPCVYFSHSLFPSKCKYNVWNYKLFDIKQSLEEWKHRLEGLEYPFIVWTDHKKLAYSQTAKHLNSHQAHWVLDFGCFNIPDLLIFKKKCETWSTLCSGLGVMASPSCYNFFLMCAKTQHSNCQNGMQW